MSNNRHHRHPDYSGRIARDAIPTQYRCAFCRRDYLPQVAEALCRECITLLVTDPNPDGWLDLMLRKRTQH